MSETKTVGVRTATTADARAVIELDAHSERAAEITAAIEKSLVLVAESADRIVGFAVRGRFFGNEFLELILVDPAQRRQGVATALVRHLEETSSNHKLFTSTNQSNVAMQRLCDRLGFEPSGRVENLDEGDPELIYFKRLRRLRAGR